MKKEYLKKFGIGLVAAIVLLAILNAPYFLKQLKFATGGVGHSSGSQQQDDQGKIEPNQLRIPSLDIQAPIVHITEKTEPAFQAALANGVVLYPGTPEVGNVGNSYIFGHSSDFALKKGSYKTVFALLPKIEIGAEIFVSNPEGKQFKYKVLDTKVVAKNDLSVLGQETGGKKILSLQTSYPVGTALKRFVVRSELVE